MSLLFLFPEGGKSLCHKICQRPPGGSGYPGNSSVSTHKLKSIGWKPPTDTYSGLAQLMDSFS